MPMLFIHGVNVRDTDANYAQHVATRNALLSRHVLKPLSVSDARFDKMRIVNPYWGKYGVTFRWNLASVPHVSALEALGGDDELTQANFLFAQNIEALTGVVPDSPELESLGSDGGQMLLAARHNLTTFTESLLLPLLLSEARLDDRSMPEDEGFYQAMLASAVYEAAMDPNVQAAVAVAATDDEVLALLKDAVIQHFEKAVVDEIEAPSVDNDVEELGPDWLEALAERIRELFDRTAAIPGRATSLVVLEKYRELVHSNLSRFLGDVFVYINERENQGKVGPIIDAVRKEIQAAIDESPDEPVVVITHSMGGNILYDILTHYNPELAIDVWISVGGQVAQFEEMKLFKVSESDIGAPQKVAGTTPNVGYWLNIYDPADVLSFKAAPVFADVNADIEFLTGVSTLKAHGEYFGRASFYELIRTHIEHAMLST